MTKGYYDWGEFRHETLLAISSIIAVIVALGHEQRAKKYKDYYNNLFIKQLQV